MQKDSFSQFLKCLLLCLICWVSQVLEANGNILVVYGNKLKRKLVISWVTMIRCNFKQPGDKSQNYGEFRYNFLSSCRAVAGAALWDLGRPFHPLTSLS